jgi:hypothetical protein
MVVIFCMEQTKSQREWSSEVEGDLSRLLSIAMENTSKPELIQSAYCDEYGERCLYRCRSDQAENLRCS